MERSQANDLIIGLLRKTSVAVTTPSLRLYLDNDMWYCFGCSEHAGDVVQWTEQTEGVGWPGH
jgi:hypothetical protein